MLAASKNRLRWADLSHVAQAAIEDMLGSSVSRAQNCPGGYSPGLASRLSLVDGRRAFVKAIDVNFAEPAHQLAIYRSEIAVATQLPPDAPAPRLLGTIDDGGFVALAFEDIDGTEPQPWRESSLRQVLDSVAALGEITAPGLPTDHPRLGGWREVDSARLAAVEPWAADNLDRLIKLEADGLDAANGGALVHFDLYAHNILLAADRAYFVDWPHARQASPAVDVVSVMASAAADGLAPQAFEDHRAIARLGTAVVDSVLAAVAGFLVSGALEELPPELAPIAREKHRLGAGALGWLRHRIAG